MKSMKYGIQVLYQQKWRKDDHDSGKLAYRAELTKDRKRKTPPSCSSVQVLLQFEWSNATHRIAYPIKKEKVTIFQYTKIRIESFTGC